MLFQTASDFGRPVRELLAGAPGPLMHMEWYLWARWRVARARLQQQARKK